MRVIIVQRNAGSKLTQNVTFPIFPFNHPSFSVHLFVTAPKHARTPQVLFILDRDKALIF